MRHGFRKLRYFHKVSSCVYVYMPIRSILCTETYAKTSRQRAKVYWSEKGRTRIPHRIMNGPVNGVIRTIKGENSRLWPLWPFKIIQLRYNVFEIFIDGLRCKVCTVANSLSIALFQTQTSRHTQARTRTHSQHNMAHEIFSHIVT